MTLSEAIAAFHKRAGVPVNSPAGSTEQSIALELFNTYCSISSIRTPDELTGDRLRDFLARWYVEQASADLHALPAPSALLDSLAGFLNWADEQVLPGISAECLPVVGELERTLPRALEIFSALAESVSQRGGAFSFPEFLTSFEEGGRSLYDIDEPGEAGAREGYFRVLLVEDTSAEVEDILTGESLRAVIFPREIAAMLDAQYILNLEMVRASDGWHMVGSGLVYPPGTEI